MLEGIIEKGDLHVLLALEEAFACCASTCPSPQSPEPDTRPGWCKCGRCRPMETQTEQICCRRTHGDCTLTINWTEISNIVLYRENLIVALRNRNEILAYNEDINNKSLRYSAYRQYVLWKWGHMGKRNRAVIPSCVVWKIRSKFPAAPGEQYKGFVPTRFGFRR